MILHSRRSVNRSSVLVFLSWLFGLSLLDIWGDGLMMAKQLTGFRPQSMCGQMSLVFLMYWILHVYVEKTLTAKSLFWSKRRMNLYGAYYICFSSFQIKNYISKSAQHFEIFGGYAVKTWWLSVCNVHIIWVK